MFVSVWHLGAVVNTLPVLFAKVKPSASEVGAENELNWSFYLMIDQVISTFAYKVPWIIFVSLICFDVKYLSCQVT